MPTTADRVTTMNHAVSRADTFPFSGWLSACIPIGTTRFPALTAMTLARSFALAALLSVASLDNGAALVTSRRPSAMASDQTCPDPLARGLKLLILVCLIVGMETGNREALR